MHVTVRYGCCPGIFGAAVSVCVESSTSVDRARNAGTAVCVGARAPLFRS